MYMHCTGRTIGTHIDYSTVLYRKAYFQLKNMILKLIKVKTN